MNFLEQQLKAAGFYDYGLVDIGDIRFSQEVRKMCEANKRRHTLGSAECRFCKKRGSLFFSCRQRRLSNRRNV